VLHVEKVGVHDNFFDLGGHSLLMIQVHSALQERLKRDLPVIELFEYPTIDSLARYLSHGKSGPSSSQQTDGRVEKIKEGKNRLVQQFKQRQRAAKKGGTSNE
jgi:acyl carrier protein